MTDQGHGQHHDHEHHDHEHHDHEHHEHKNHDHPSGPEAGRTSRLATGFADADRSAGLLLWQVTNRWQAAQRAALKPYDLTHVQFVLLASLTWLQSDGPVTQRNLADHAATDPMMTSQVLRVLEARGLVVRESHPHDRRARALAATPDGRALANRAIVAVEACDAEFFGALGDDVPAFATALLRLRNAAHPGLRDA